MNNTSVTTRSTINKTGKVAALTMAAILLVSALPLGAAFVFTSTAPVVETPLAEPVRYIVGFHALPLTLRAGDALFGGSVVSLNTAIHFAVVETHTPKTLQALAKADPRVSYVELDRIIENAFAVLPVSGELQTMEAPSAALTPTDGFYGYMYQTLSLIHI